MTHVVTESCIKCKYTDCVDVCPVDCFHEGPNMLVIDPDECIDCAVCIPECPVNAILPEEDVPEVCAAVLTLDFGAHPVAVRNALHCARDGIIKCWPAATGIELALGSIEFCVAAAADVRAVFERILVLAGERSFSPSIFDHMLLF